MTDAIDIRCEGCGKAPHEVPYLTILPDAMARKLHCHACWAKVRPSAYGYINTPARHRHTPRESR